MIKIISKITRKYDMLIQESWKRKKTGVWVLCVFNTELKQEAVKRRIHLSTPTVSRSSSEVPLPWRGPLPLASASPGVPPMLLDFLYTPDILYPSSAALPVLMRDCFQKDSPCPNDTLLSESRVLSSSELTYLALLIEN